MKRCAAALFVRSVAPLVLLALLAACAPRPPAPAAPEPSTVTLSILGTSDVHGALDRLPIFAGHVDNLRAARAADGDVLILDAGDMFQGTLESNLNEGAALIDAYNAIGYTAAAIGNHELDFGPAGPRATPVDPDDDPRGALRERIAQARFPLLGANLVDATAQTPLDWPASFMHHAAGVPVGVIGVTTRDTLQTTMAANVRDLAMAPLAATIEREARALRRQGAAVIVVAAHAGGRCTDFDDPEDLSSCRPDEEIMEVARALPPGLVDVIVAGHTHQAMAHRVNGIAIIQSYASGRAFGRVDVTVARDPARVTAARVFPPHELCPTPKCAPGDYEGRPVVPDAAVSAIAAQAAARADELRSASLGVVISAPIPRAYGEESALGNLVADLMRQAMGGDVGVTNGGGLRAELPAGPLTYGALHRAQPFDNRFATVRLAARDLARIIAANLQERGGVLSVSGIRVTAACRGAELVIQLDRETGAAIADDEMLTIVTSDFLASGGSGFYGPVDVPASAITVHDVVVRDALADALRQRGGALSGQDRSLHDPGAPRLRYPGVRPVTCPAP